MENADNKEVHEYIFYSAKKDLTALVNTKDRSIFYKSPQCDPRIMEDAWTCSSIDAGKDSLFWLNEHLRDEGYEFIDVLDGSVTYYTENE